MLSGRRAQLWRHQPEFRRPRHFHEEPELNLVLGGTAVLGVGDRVVTATRGDLLSFAPGQDHILLEASPDLSLFVLALRREVADRVPDWTPQALGSGFRCAEAECERLGALLHDVNGVVDVTASETALGDVFASAVRHSRRNHVLSARVLACVEQDPRLSNATLARRLNTAPSAISRLFHRDLGLTFVEFRARRRLMRFVALVDAGATFLRAALEADFGSYAQCHRVFQRALGCSPQQYFAGQRHSIDEARLPAS